MSARVSRKRVRVDEDQDPQHAGEENKPEVAPGPDLPGVSRSLQNDDVARDAPVLTRDEEFWFNDGTVILVAGDIEFRVYTGILAHYSPVFKDLFAQQHPHRTVTIDGKQSIECPVITVLDSPHDLRHILRAYMSRQGASFFVSLAKPPTFDEISASIRLGHKYKFTSLFDQALRFLKDHYTDDFGKWIDIEVWQPSGWKQIQAIGVMNLARLTGELSLLLTALLACLQLGAEIVSGFDRAGGTRENLTLEDLGLLFSAKA